MSVVQFSTVTYFLLYCSCWTRFVFCQNEYYDDQGWKDAADFILTGLNKNGNPCQDFYDFACGTWEQNEGTSSTDENARLDSYTQARILEAITAVDVNDAKVPRHAKWLRVFYDQCLQQSDVTAMEKIDQLFYGLVRTMGLPPILSTDQTEKDQLLRRNIWRVQGMIQREVATGVFFSAIVSQVPTVDNQDVMEYVLRFTPALQTDRINATSVFNFVKLLAQMMNTTVDDQQLRKKIQNMINLEYDLLSYRNKTEEAEADKIRQKHKNVTAEELVQLMTKEVEETVDYEGLIALNPKINWDEYFQGLFSPEQFEAWNETDHRMIIDQTIFFKELDGIVKRYDVETIFNYAFWKVTNDFAKVFAENDENKAESCLKSVMKLFAPATAKVLFDYQEWDITAWRTDVEMIGETIFAAFKFLVQSVDWLDNEEKMALLTKLNYISFSSGIPTWLTNDTEVDARTFQFESDRGFYDNIMNIVGQSYQAQLDQVVYLDNDEPNPDFVVNAYYSGMKLQTLLGALLPPMYHVNYPLSVKYGNIGWTYGHELLHAFDENHIDEMPPTVAFLLKDHSKLAYTQRKSCLIRQMAAYCYKEQKKCVNGKVTLGENMADIDGMKIAFMAYKFATQTIGDEPPLPNLFEYSGDQLFFMTAARSYCTNGKDLDLYLSDDPDVHPPNRARVETSVRNFQAFAKTFNCVVGSPTAPVKTCSIWGNYYAPKRL